jgi:hypothetical protein
MIGVPGQLSPTDAEVVVDVIGQDQTSKRYDKIIPGGIKDLTQRTSHLEGAVPAGGNILFEDVHVDWRQFSAMRQKLGPNTSAIRTFGDDPKFMF